MLHHNADKRFKYGTSCRAGIRVQTVQKLLPPLLFVEQTLLFQPLALNFLLLLLARIRRRRRLLLRRRGLLRRRLLLRRGLLLRFSKRLSRFGRGAAEE